VKIQMRLKNWLFLFWTTLLIGVIAAVGTGIYMEFGQLEYDSTADWFIGLIGKLGAGLMFSLIAQMGFFAYLTIHYFALILFKAKWVWQTAQVIIVAIVFVDLAYFRQFLNADKIVDADNYFILPGVLLILSILVAVWKSKLTNLTAFVPTVFFMFVFTSLEAFPAIRLDNELSIQLMTGTLLICNAWQILQLHRLVSKKADQKS
jgi:KinB signaling pathway activation protein